MTDPPTPIESQVRHGQVEVGDGIIPVAMAGNGPLLILLHGWTLDWRMWSPQIEELSQDFLLAMPDRRGFGRSTAPPDLAKEADDVERIAAFLGFERYALLGLSQGGAVALDCAHRRGSRIDALIVSGAPLPALVDREEVIELARYEVLARSGDIEAVRADWSRHQLMRHDKPATKGLVDRMLADYDGRDLLAPSQLPDVSREALSHLSVPLLAMTGVADSRWRRDCARALADLVPHSNYSLVDGAGHLANLDNPPRFNRVVSDFLLKCRPSHDDREAISGPARPQADEGRYRDPNSTGDTRSAGSLRGSSPRKVHTSGATEREGFKNG